jgi:phosphatidylcholine synthase
VRKLAAYSVHLLTASGAAVGLWSLILIYDGYYQEALWALAAAAVIDSVDGALARAAGTKQHAAKIDGALMDNLVDFLTWTVAPLLWIYATMQIPFWVLLICATASAFGFTNTQAKTDNHFFLGFPSYWNLVILYLFLLDLPLEFSIACLLIFAVATFLPIKFIYPTKTPFLKNFTLFLGILYFFQITAIVILFDEASMLLVYSSFIFPIYYFTLSFYLNITHNETLIQP